ncbi:DUF6441 family protein [Gemmobacter sp.]|uniref:DUF6441 family protein n=1 Tax=Gemmobacter sp. TaxID=1898957 RepID=UPI003A59991B
MLILPAMSDPPAAKVGKIRTTHNCHHQKGHPHEKLRPARQHHHPERAVSAAIREAGTGLKTAWRLQITGAGLGPRLARTIRSEQFPKATPTDHRHTADLAGDDAVRVFGTGRNR